MEKKYKKHNQNQNEVSYWKSSTDLLSALLLVMILVILLLILYLLQMTGEQYAHFMGSDGGNMEAAGGFESTSETETESTTEETSGGPGLSVGSPYETGTGGWESTSQNWTLPYAQAGAGAGFGSPDEEGEKSAVYVMLIDAETERTVKEAGVTFELYGDDNGLQILNTYYPERITYRTYETTDKGVFYLPEKIHEDGYYLRELTEASGYDLAEDQHFVINRYYDWPEPYVVRIPVNPSKNVIRVRMTDRENGQSVPYGKFEVVAAEDILTLDGTLRFREGEVADIISCDEDGYGESGELYLGHYLLRQSDIPQYYAGLAEQVEHEVVKKTEASNGPEQIYNDRTKVVLTLRDELTGHPIEGADFRVYYDGGLTDGEVHTTNTAGQISIDKIEKNTGYHFEQLNRVGEYLPMTEPVSVDISREGRIGDSAEIGINAVNRMLRLTIGMSDAVLGNQISDRAMSLFDMDGTLIRTWTTSGTPASFDGLAEGSYRLVVGGNEAKPYFVTVSNTADMQQFNIRTWTWMSYASIAGGVLLLVIVLYGVIHLLRSLSKKKDEDTEKKDTQE